MGTIAFRRDSASDWTSANPTLLVGELGIETDTLKIKMGDGSSAWSSLGYLGWNDPPFVILTAMGSVAGILAGNSDNSINKFSCPILLEGMPMYRPLMVLMVLVQI